MDVFFSQCNMKFDEIMMKMMDFKRFLRTRCEILSSIHMCIVCFQTDSFIITCSFGFSLSNRLGRKIIAGMHLKYYSKQHLFPLQCTNSVLKLGNTLVPESLLLQ